MRRAKEVSAGGVVYRNLRGGPVIALCKRWGGKVWCLPKGLVERGETQGKTALREVLEETGVRSDILERLGEIRYRFRRPGGRGLPVEVSKRVTFYLMRRMGGNITDHDDEVEEVRWFPIESAPRRATFPGERRMIRKAAGILARTGREGFGP